MNATEKDTATEIYRVCVPRELNVEAYVRARIPALRDPRNSFEYQRLETIGLQWNYWIEVRIRRRTPKETHERGVPNCVLKAAESECQRLRHVARIALESYREARDKVTQLRQRRAAYEVRQRRGIDIDETIKELKPIREAAQPEGTTIVDDVTKARECFAEISPIAFAGIARHFRLTADILRDSQGQSGPTAARQVGERARHRPDPAAGESGPAGEV